MERARYEADRAERAFSQVEPENWLVARDNLGWALQRTRLSHLQSAHSENAPSPA
ncbi:hypothetical protein [Streptomyces brasiliensis]|uniref:Uncharacterized protein n=1 Tax=Streptomyces brasiliensis TaxID=1954 RepID=A0A917L915_9ACTN|nr:hypothetical protein [Streptomyces brasiliensis]GGJ53014.1 hypothetical protein GCM10010121_074780 [Streptomyces brasiliensis]